MCARLHLLTFRFPSPHHTHPLHLPFPSFLNHCHSPSALVYHCPHVSWTTVVVTQIATCQDDLIRWDCLCGTVASASLASLFVRLIGVLPVPTATATLSTSVMLQSVATVPVARGCRITTSCYDVAALFCLLVNGVRTLFLFSLALASRVLLMRDLPFFQHCHAPTAESNSVGIGVCATLSRL